MTATQLQTLRLIAKGVIEAVVAAGSLGAPGGVLYAAMMTQGCTLNQFQSIMDGLVKAAMLTQDGDLYYATDHGRGFVGAA